jgi:uridylate kinase
MSDTRESYGTTMVIRMGQNGGVNLTTTYRDYMDMQQTLLDAMPVAEALQRTLPRITVISTEELKFLEEFIQAEWDRRARLRLQLSKL